MALNERCVTHWQTHDRHCCHTLFQYDVLGSGMEVAIANFFLKTEFPEEIRLQLHFAGQILRNKY